MLGLVNCSLQPVRSKPSLSGRLNCSLEPREEGPVSGPLKLLPKRREEGPVIRPLKLLPETPAKQAKLLGLLNCSLEPREEGPVIRPLKLLPETPAKQAQLLGLLNCSLEAVYARVSNPPFKPPFKPPFAASSDPPLKPPLAASLASTRKHGVFGLAPCHTHSRWEASGTRRPKPLLLASRYKTWGSWPSPCHNKKTYSSQKHATVRDCVVKSLHSSDFRTMKNKNKTRFQGGGI